MRRRAVDLRRQARARGKHQQRENRTPRTQHGHDGRPPSGEIGLCLFRLTDETRRRLRHRILDCDRAAPDISRWKRCQRMRWRPRAASRRRSRESCLNTVRGQPFSGSKCCRAIESTMHNIELYFGSTEELNSSEQQALERVVRWLAEHEQAAVILCDISVNGRQVDILVGTETTTLQLEVKGFRAPVTGQENGEWTLNYADGSTRRVGNGYVQALRNNQALRNAMSEHRPDGEAVSYPKGAVLFEPEIPPGSNLRIHVDPRVEICGADALELLLSTRGRAPWPLAWLRAFAHERELIPRAIPVATTARTVERASAPTWEVVAMPVASIVKAAEVVEAAEPASSRAPAPVRPASRSADENTTFTVAPRPAAERGHVSQDTARHAPLATARAGGHTPFGSGDAIARRPKRRRTVLRYASVAIAAAAIAYAAAHRHRAATVAATPAAASQPVEHTARAPAKAPRGERHGAVRQAAHESRAPVTSASPNDTVTAAHTRADETRAPVAAVAAMAAPATSAITCPAGVDRLGCNGRTGTLAAPECPPAFHAQGNTCVRDREN
ncbi:nuclease-related domain-containing protein [Burkholderia vietnamiensis]|uniref:nuclease-related domain-containing protein n=1 Tax=Burkholderia vietnamiensis TaxID=60552 RepID=UPI003132ADF2